MPKKKKQQKTQQQDDGKVYIQQLQKNLEYFRKHRPNLYKMLANMDLRRAELVVTPGRSDVDMVVDGKSCYRGLALEYSLEEAQRMLEENPETKRIQTFAPPSTKSYQQENFAAKLLREIVQSSPASQRSFTGYIRGNIFPSMVFLGCGLGYHIDYVVSKTQIINGIIIERDPEKFVVSLYTVDWAKICSRFSRKGHSLTFAVGEANNADEIRRLVSQYMSKDVPFYPFFSTYYNHLADIELARGVIENGKDLAVIATNWSNYDTELMRLSNTVYNARQGISYIPSDTGTVQNKPLVVVGSGPSLDKRIDSLKAVRDRVVVVSAGTALRPLLAHGVRPDYHAELDPSYLIYELLSDIGKDRIRDIPLLAVNEVNPFVPGLFNERYFYFKSDNGQSALLGVKEKSFNNCNPTVTNAAISIGHALGFRQIYLFGTDYGFEHEDQDHSSKSVYGADTDSKMSAEIHRRAAKQGRRVFHTPSVNGGFVLTRNDYYTAKRSVEELIYNLKTSPHPPEIFNCADGAVIVGTAWLGEEEFLAHFQDEQGAVQQFSASQYFSERAKRLADDSMDHKLPLLDKELQRVSKLYVRKVKSANLRGRRDLCALVNEIRGELAVLAPLKGNAAVTEEQLFCRQLVKGTIQHFTYAGLCHGMACTDDELGAFLRLWEEKFLAFLDALPKHFQSVMMADRALEADLWGRRNIGDRDPEFQGDSDESEAPTFFPSESTKS